MQTPLCPRVTNLGRLKDGSELPLRHTAAPTGALLLCELPCWSTSVSLYHLKKGWKFLKCMHNKRTFPASNRVFENQWTLKSNRQTPDFNPTESLCHRLKPAQAACDELVPNLSGRTGQISNLNCVGCCYLSTPTDLWKRLALIWLYFLTIIFPNMWHFLRLKTCLSDFKKYIYIKFKIWVPMS